MMLKRVGVKVIQNDRIMTRIGGQFLPQRTDPITPKEYSPTLFAATLGRLFARRRK